MAEILLFGIVGVILFTPQLIAGFMAKSMGKSFWFWFLISFVIPIISIFILIFKKDEDPGRKHKLADHVKEG